MTAAIRRRRGEGGPQEGAVLILTALLITAVFVMVAIVLDTGLVRTDRQVNKSVADHAAVAGGYELRAGPWKAVCRAYQLVLANSPEFSSFESEDWHNLDPDPLTQTSYTPSSSGQCPTAGASGPPPYGASCTTDEASWAAFHGVAAGGRITVDIQSGYRMPDPAFGEDAEYVGDDGEPCDQIAVIVSERRPPGFSTVIGADDITSKVRSVGRLVTGLFDVAALVVLEKTDCRAIDATTNGGKIEIMAVDGRPGIIQVDSDGSLQCDGQKKVVEGSPLPSGGGANIIAHGTADTPPLPGQIGIQALRTNPGNAHTESCDPPGTVATCSITPHPTARSPIGRGLLDERYINGVNALRAEAAALFAQDPPPAPYRRLTEILGITNCNNVSVVQDVPDQYVYVDCNLNLSNGALLRFTANDSEIVTSGTLSVGSGATLEILNPRRVFVEGTTQTQKTASGLSGSGTLRVNHAGEATCADRFAADRSEVTRFVVGGGSFSAGAQGAVQLCQTTVHMMSGAIDPAPLENEYNGWINVGGQGRLDWSAPNRIGAGAVQSDWDNLEDLALWTESAMESSISGGGGIELAGVFALPHADPFTITGQGGQRIGADAQFWTRRLRLAGQGTLEMAPNPDDSIPVFAIGLVR